MASTIVLITGKHKKYEFEPVRLLTELRRCQLRRGLRSIKGASLRLGHFPRHHGQPISRKGPSCNVRARSS